MAFVNLSGILTNSIGGIDVGATLKMTHLSTTGDTLSSTITELIIPPNGAYDIDLNFGIVRFDYTTEFTQVFLATTTINGDTTATTITELLNSVVPPTNAQLLLFQDILADAVTAETNAAASAASAAANADDTVINFPVLNDAIISTDTTIMISGRALDITDRTSGGGGGAMWDVVLASSVTTNTFNIVQCVGVPLLALVLRISKTLDIRAFGVSVLINDNTSAILAAHAYMEARGGVITLTDVFGYTTPMVLDTSLNKKQVIFRGTGNRVSGFSYRGGDDAVNIAFQIGDPASASSGFTSMINCGVYGQGQDIDPVKIFKAQRYCELDQFVVRDFAGLLLACGSGDVFLNSWGSIYLLNGARACNLGAEFNANSVANIVIENMTLTSPRFTQADPVALIDGIGTNINTMSIENCPSNICLKIVNKVTVSALYQENNHGENVGVGARPLVMSGPSPRVEAGNIKLAGFNANETDFFALDLDDSNRAYVGVSYDLPTLNPTSYQKAIDYGTSTNSEINCNWEIFDGVGMPSRQESTSFSLPLGNTRINNIDYVFGMPKAFVGRLLMTQYCIAPEVGRAMIITSNNRPEGFTEVNINSSSKMTRDFSFDRSRYVCKYSQAAAGTFEIYKDLTLSTRRYLFTSFNFRKTTSDPLPNIRASNGTQDFFIAPNNPNFVGWTQTSLVQSFTDGGISDVRWRPMNCANTAGDVYHGMSFVCDLGQFEIDFNVSFDGMTTLEIASLIQPDMIDSEYEMKFRGVTPNFGEYDRGEIILKHPPAPGDKYGWIATAAVSDASVDNSAFRTFGDITA